MTNSTAQPSLFDGPRGTGRPAFDGVTYSEREDGDEGMTPAKMTINDFERLVLKLANQTPTRYWKHWNYPREEPWFMGVSVQFQHVDEPQLIEELEVRGLELSSVPMPDGARLFTIERDRYREDRL